MKTPEALIRVTAAIMSRNGKVLIARRPPGARQSNLWEFPGGKMEAGETPEECLRRELKEEFDIIVEVGEFLCSSIYPYDFGTIELMAYRVRWNGGDMRIRDHTAVTWASPEDLAGFAFAPADVVFVRHIMDGGIPI